MDTPLHVVPTTIYWGVSICRAIAAAEILRQADVRDRCIAASVIGALRRVWRIDP